MCGINVVFSYDRTAPRVNREEILSTRDAMVSRGPDGAGLWISSDAKIGMGHRRLAIIDLSEVASQPMSIMNDRYRIVFNGEIYNYQHFRCELTHKDCQFKSSSDTEVLLHLYAIHGAKMVNKL